jgi:hypothetical protein
VDGARDLRTIAEWEQFDAQYNTVEDLRIQRFVKGSTVAGSNSGGKDEDASTTRYCQTKL